GRVGGGGRGAGCGWRGGGGARGFGGADGVADGGRREESRTGRGGDRVAAARRRARLAREAGDRRESIGHASNVLSSRRQLRKHSSVEIGGLQDLVRPRPRPRIEQGE